MNLKQAVKFIMNALLINYIRQIIKWKTRIHNKSNNSAYNNFKRKSNYLSISLKLLKSLKET